MAIEKGTDRYDSLLRLLAMAVGASEASIWLPSDDSRSLVMAHSPFQEPGAPKPAQSLDEGRISEVFRTGRLMEDTGMFRNPLASSGVDTALEQKTVAMIAAPIRENDRVIGVLTTVQLITRDTRPAKWGFRDGATEMVKLAAETAARMAR